MLRGGQEGGNILEWLGGGGGVPPATLHTVAGSSAGSALPPCSCSSSSGRLQAGRPQPMSEPRRHLWTRALSGAPFKLYTVLLSPTSGFGKKIWLQKRRRGPTCSEVHPLGKGVLLPGRWRSERGAERTVLEGGLHSRRGQHNQQGWTSPGPKKNQPALLGHLQLKVPGQDPGSHRFGPGWELEGRPAPAGVGGGL